MDISESMKSSKIFTVSNDVEDSRLIKYLKYSTAQTVEKYLSYIGFSLFKQHYPNVCEANRLDLKEFHGQLLSQLKSNLLENIEAGHILRNFHWRPTGSPNEDMRDHFHQSKLRQKRSLEFILKALSFENDSLEKILAKNHKELMEVKSKIDCKYQEVENHCTALDDPRICELKEKLLNVRDKSA